VLTVGYASGSIPNFPVESLLYRNISLIGVWATPSHYPEEVAQSAIECVKSWSAG
jgi:hypothetical protein